MNFEELLDYSLDLEEAGQFEYFEALADLVEMRGAYRDGSHIQAF